MCLDVKKSHVRSPIPELDGVKVLEYVGLGRWSSPVYPSVVPMGTGWFKPKKPSRRNAREYRSWEQINGGYLHLLMPPPYMVGFWPHADHDKVYTTIPPRPVRGETYRFKAVACDVVAVGRHSDLVCKALYIPAFDVTGNHRNAILDMSS